MAKKEITIYHHSGLESTVLPESVDVWLRIGWSLVPFDTKSSFDTKAEGETLFPWPGALPDSAQDSLDATEDTWPA